MRQASTMSMITHLQFTHSFLLSGSSDGYLYTHDPRTGLRKEDGESLVKAHVSGIQGLQCSGNFAFTIGWGLRWKYSVCVDTGLILLCLQTISPIPRSIGEGIRFTHNAAASPSAFPHGASLYQCSTQATF